MSAINTASATFDNAAQNILGVATWWTIHSERYNYQGVINALAGQGLYDEIKPTTNRKAFSDACEDVALDLGLEARQVIDDTEKLVYRFTRPEVDKEHQSVNLAQGALFTLIKNVDEFHGEGDSAIVESVRQRRELYKASVPRDVIYGYITKKLRKADMIALGERGKPYFIPRQGCELVAKLKLFVAAIGAGKVDYLNIVNDSQGRESTLNGVKEDLNSRLDKLNEAVDAVGSRVSSMDSKQEENDEIKDLLNLYSELLEGEGKVDDIKNRCQELDLKINGKIAELEQQKIAKKAERIAAKLTPSTQPIADALLTAVN